MAICSTCGTPVMFDINGQPQMSEEPVAQEPVSFAPESDELVSPGQSPFSSVISPDQKLDEPLDDPLGDPLEDTPDERSGVTWEMASPDEPPPPLEVPFAAPSAEIEPLSPMDISQPEEVSPIETHTPDFAATSDLETPEAEFDLEEWQKTSEQPPEAPAVEFGREGDPLGLNGFANSEASQAKEGNISYKILIMGIDSKEIRDSLREVIEDSRFGWDPDALISSIARGKLVISGVSPVKATILISRIKRLPVTITWEQYDLFQTDGA